MFGIADAIKQEQMALFNKKPQPTATTWVSKDRDGNMQVVEVVKMEDTHLWRWIRYFRKKYRDGGFQGTDAQLDALIKLDMITAPAIYAEAQKRGIWKPPKEAPRAEVPEAAPTVERERGFRKIDLEE